MGVVINWKREVRRGLWSYIWLIYTINWALVSRIICFRKKEVCLFCALYYFFFVICHFVLSLVFGQKQYILIYQTKQFLIILIFIRIIYIRIDWSRYNSVNHLKNGQWLLMMLNIIIYLIYGEKSILNMIDNELTRLEISSKFISMYIIEFGSWTK